MLLSFFVSTIRVTQPPDTYRSSSAALSEREQMILRLVVESFVDKAGPVGSRFLTKQHGLDLSPASVRNAMSDLEDQGYLSHPYTSAGRVPTEQGYRAYVDRLMAPPQLDPPVHQLLATQLQQRGDDHEHAVAESSKLLGRLSNLLGVALTPSLSTGVLERLNIVSLSSDRLLFVLSVQGGLVRTLVLEFEADLKPRAIDRVTSILNERLAGLTLQQIRETYKTRTKDIVHEQTGLVQFVRDESHTIFSESTEGRLRYGGTQQLMAQPEFQEPDVIRDFIGLLEDEHYVVHWLEDHRRTAPEGSQRATISIGKEHSDAKVERYSVVTAPYTIGDTVGTIGVIGPTRMKYDHIIALVEAMAQLLSQPATSERM
jgi:heat-inducible transcriptional repressor